MATRWMKSQQCRSKAFEDVCTPLNNSSNDPKPPPLTNLISTSNCRQTVQNLKDIVEVSSKHLHKSDKPNKGRHKPPPPAPPKSHPRSRISKVEQTEGLTRTIRGGSYFPALTELPDGHPSRNVVEIIFHTSWSPHKGFPGRVDVIFKVQHVAKTVTRFEEYREVVKARNGSGQVENMDPRCVADGNEVMGFQCLGPAMVEGGGAWGVPSGKGMCTFSGSGAAHENGGGGGGRGRRAMIVCRVIAGRVGRKVGSTGEKNQLIVGADSAGGENGELFVFNSRAVLPCFLIIYKL